MNNSQLRDHLDSSIGIGLTANLDKFGLFTDFGYMKFSGSTAQQIDSHSLQQNYSLKFVVGNFDGSYVLYKSDSDTPFILAGTVGLRYWYTSTEINTTDNGVQTFSGSNDRSIVDPVIGLRASQYFTEKLHLDVAGDFGGFGANNNIDTTWSAGAMASYDFARWFTLSAGFKALALNEQTTENGVNLTFYGFAAAATFKF